MKYLFFLFALAILACKGQNSDASQIPSIEKDVQVTSLDGRVLLPLEESQKTVNRKDSLLTVAKENYLKDNTNLDHIIWFGRRTAYLYEYHDAIDIYTSGIILHPDAPKLYRHRGHRYISIRDFDKAISDLQVAAKLIEGLEIEIEPDGIPNKLNIPLSNLQFNVYYHWALAHYLKGEFGTAAELYEKCMEYSINPDLLTATSDWLYMAYMRSGEKKRADQLLQNITEDMAIIENESYFKRLLMYKGVLKPSDLIDLNNQEEEAQLDIVTQGYGVGNWYLYNGDEEKAKEIFEKVLACKYWPAFGYIAAEAELN